MFHVVDQVIVRSFSSHFSLLLHVNRKITIGTRIPTDSISHTPSQPISSKEFNFTIASRQTINIRIRSFLKPKQNVESIAKYAFKHREPDDETKYYDTPASKLGNSVWQERNTESNSARKQLTRVQAKTIVQLAAWFFRPIYRPKVRFNPLTLFSANPLLATCAFRVSLD